VQTLYLGNVGNYQIETIKCDINVLSDEGWMLIFYYGLEGAFGKSVVKTV
jgi:hypothetical protein